MIPQEYEIRVVGADDLNLDRLREIERYREYDFVPLCRHEELRSPLSRPLPRIIDEALGELRSRRPAAIIAYWDFPENALARYLSGELGLRSTSLESVLACEHKYWARTLQADVSPRLVPPFELLDPCEHRALEQIHLDPPFWIKPIKATGSALSFRVETESDADRALERIRAEIGAFAEPFDHLLSLARVPDWVREIGGRHCIVEKSLSGSQCTVSGFVHNDEVTIIGVVDSLSYPGTSTFSAFVHPSRLTPEVQDRLRRSATEVITPFGLQESGFNIEFFYDEETDSLSVLEVNPRFSQSHADLYLRVDGTSNHQLLLDLALGNDPTFRQGAGTDAVAAKFFERVFEDVEVTHVAGSDEIRAIERRHDCRVALLVQEGDRLRHKPTEDAYSHDIAHVYLGASSYEQARRKYERIIDDLSIQYRGLRE
ncbi:MAG: ATP-grasp domain-containing protein [Spirochaetota bacterium]